VTPWPGPAQFGRRTLTVVQQDTGRVIAGNGRLIAMQALGWTRCDVVELDLEGIDAVALGLALNRTAELAAWDEPALAKLLTQLREEDGLDGVGFSDEEIALLLRTQEGEIVLEDEGAGERPEHPVSQAGDLWLLGEHRLLCGNSTDAACAERLLAGEQPRLMVTDPPYGVSYDPVFPRREPQERPSTTARSELPPQQAVAPQTLRDCELAVCSQTRHEWGQAGREHASRPCSTGTRSGGSGPDGRIRCRWSRAWTSAPNPTRRARAVRR
jgi:hypothetical protein